MKLAAEIDRLDKLVGNALLRNELRLGDVGNNPVHVKSVRIGEPPSLDACLGMAALAGVAAIYQDCDQVVTVIGTEMCLELMDRHWGRCSLSRRAAKNILDELETTPIGVDTRVEQVKYARDWRISEERVRHRVVELFPDLHAGGEAQVHTEAAGYFIGGILKKKKCLTN